jgi:hypothetical protein
MIFLVNHPQIKYHFWLSVPENPNTLVFWFHGSTTESKEQLILKRPIEFELAISLLPPDCIVVTPSIPKLSEEIAGRIIDPQCLCRNVLFDHLIDPTFALYNRPDKEILKIFEYLKVFVFPIIQKTFNSFVVGGFSAGGNFSSLFSVLYPKCISHVISVISCSFCLPVRCIDNTFFDFPFGIRSLDLISDIAPNLEVQKQIRYFIYHGELDDHDPVQYFANNDIKEAKTIKSILGETSTERTSYSIKMLRDMGFRVEGHIIPGIGHAIHDKRALKEMLANFLSM